MAKEEEMWNFRPALLQPSFSMLKLTHKRPLPTPAMIDVLDAKQGQYTGMYIGHGMTRVVYALSSDEDGPHANQVLKLKRRVAVSTRTRPRCAGS
jgi:hypothetical protein